VVWQSSGLGGGYSSVATTAAAIWLTAVFLVSRCYFTSLLGRASGLILNLIGPERIVELLNELFRGFDEQAVKLGVEKIKTIGDADLAASGVPTAHSSSAACILAMSDSMHAVTEKIAAK
jgi:hypothetical protein